MFRPISREGGLLLNNLLLGTAAATVLLGTLYPLFLEAIGGDKVSVGPPFFNAVFIPLIAPLVVAMAVGPLLPWKRADIVPALKRLWLAAAAAAAAVAAAWTVYADAPLVGLLGMALAAWLFVGTLVEFTGRIRLFQAPAAESLRRLATLPRAAWGMTLAHAGLAVTIAGMTGAGVWKVESIQVMKPGDTVTVGSYDYLFEGAERHRGPNYTAVGGRFAVSRDGRPVVVLTPEKRTYPVERRQTTEAAIHTTFWGDLYAVIGDPAGNDGGFVTRIYFNPLVAWMWGGVAIMVVGGLLSLTDRRHRVGAPTRRRATGRVKPSPAEA
jgi:cytochrome c-type biogenesis protein CcmF